MIKLIVGLGNPGAEYSLTRHNAGFWLIDELAKQQQVKLNFNNKFHATTAKSNLQGHNLHLLEPQTFMNQSGRAVVAIANFYKILPDEILVVHDELDLLPGQVKLKNGGGHAGHNGLKDIQAALGSNKFWRLRLGIAHPGSKGQVINWVLKNPSLDHRIGIDNAIDRALKVLPEIVAGNFDKATMLLHAGN